MKIINLKYILQLLQNTCIIKHLPFISFPPLSNNTVFSVTGWLILSIFVQFSGVQFKIGGGGGLDLQNMCLVEKMEIPPTHTPGVTLSQHRPVYNAGIISE